MRPASLGSLLLPLFFIGCGYTLDHRLKKVFVHSDGIFVPVFENDTNETGVEAVFTNAFIRELQSRREITIADRDHAGLELRGTIKSIEHASTALTDRGFRGLQTYRRLPSEIGVTVEIEFVLVEQKTKKELWQRRLKGFRRVEAPLHRTFDFQAPSTLGDLTLSQIDTVYPEIAGDIMRSVYDDMLEVF